VPQSTATKAGMAEGVADVKPYSSRPLAIDQRVLALPAHRRPQQKLAAGDAAQIINPLGIGTAGATADRGVGN
jgi:hypothetical protein